MHEYAVDSAPDDTIPVIVGVGWQGLTIVSIDEGTTWCETGIMVDPYDESQDLEEWSRDIDEMAAAFSPEDFDLVPWLNELARANVSLDRS